MPTASPQSLLLGPRGSGQHPPSRKQDAIVDRTALSPHRLAHHSLPGLSQRSEPSATTAQPWSAGVPCQPLPRGHGATLLFARTVASVIKVFGCWTRPLISWWHSVWPRVCPQPSGAPSDFCGRRDILTIWRVGRRCKLKKEDSSCGFEPSCASECKPLLGGCVCPPVQIAPGTLPSGNPTSSSAPEPEEPPNVTPHEASFQMHLAREEDQLLYLKV